MMKRCSFCEDSIHDNDEIVFVGVARFKQMPSSIAYAVTKPTKCIDVRHLVCAKVDWWDELIDLPEDNNDA